MLSRVQLLAENKQSGENRGAHLCTCWFLLFVRQQKENSLICFLIGLLTLVLYHHDAQMRTMMLHQNMQFNTSAVWHQLCKNNIKNYSWWKWKVKRQLCIYFLKLQKHLVWPTTWWEKRDVSAGQSFYSWRKRNSLLVTKQTNMPSIPQQTKPKVHVWCWTHLLLKLLLHNDWYNKMIGRSANKSPKRHLQQTACFVWPAVKMHGMQLAVIWKEIMTQQLKFDQTCGVATWSFQDSVVQKNQFHISDQYNFEF